MKQTGESYCHKIGAPFLIVGANNQPNKSSKHHHQDRNYNREVVNSSREALHQSPNSFIHTRVTPGAAAAALLVVSREHDAFCVTGEGWKSDFSFCLNTLQTSSCMTVVVIPIST